MTPPARAQVRRDFRLAAASPPHQPRSQSDPLLAGNHAAKQTGARNRVWPQGVTGDPNSFDLYTPDQVQSLHAPAPLIARDSGTGKFTLTMDWKKSTDLMTFFDFPADAPGSSLSVNPITGDIEIDVEVAGWRAHRHRAS